MLNEKSSNVQYRRPRYLKCLRAVLMFVIAGATISSAFAWGATVSIKELLSYPNKFNNKVVRVQGEAIGGVLKAKNAFWINILAGDYNLGVYVDKRLGVGHIKHFGSYKVRGDIVRITGIFHKDCPIHHELDIGAIKLTVVKSGFSQPTHISSFKEITSVVLAIICLTLGLIYLIRLRYVRRN